MGAILNGVSKSIEAGSFHNDVGMWRHVRNRYDFGASGGAAAAYTIFTVTGDVMFRVQGVCQTALTSGGSATIELGIAGNTAGLIAQTTATDLDAYEVWQDGVPESNPGLAVHQFGGDRWFVIANGADVILTIGTAALTAGVIDFDAFWMPMSTDGNVT